MTVPETERAWTPGPWEASEFGDYSDFDGQSRVILGDDMRIAVVQVRSAEHEGDNANACLIAAAPEMAELLEEFNSVLDDFWNTPARDRHLMARQVQERLTACQQRWRVIFLKLKSQS